MKKPNVEPIIDAAANQVKGENGGVLAVLAIGAAAILGLVALVLPHVAPDRNTSNNQIEGSDVHIIEDSREDEIIEDDDDEM